jgi:hypothetical protein
VLVLLGVVLVLGVYLGYRAVQVRGDLADVNRDATVLSGAVVDGDNEKSKAALDRLQHDTQRAADHTGGLSWRLLEQFPIVGDDAHGASVVSEVANDLAHGSAVDLVRTAGMLSAGSFTPDDHQFPLGLIASLADPTLQAYLSFADADQRLDAVDATGFNGRVAPAFEDLRTRLDKITTLLGSAVRATNLLPGILGQDGPRNYLLVLQNNAEIRSTGGLPGTLSLIHAEDGRVEMRQQRSAGAILRSERPVIPLTGAETRIFSPTLGRYVQDANFTPDYPRAAELLAAHWKRETGQSVDGVFVIDPVTMSYLLQETGPIALEDGDLNAQNVVDSMLHLAYTLLPDQVQQNEFFETVARKTFNTFADGTGNAVGVVRALMRGVDEGRILAWVTDQGQESTLRGAEIGGQLPVRDTDRPQIGAYLDDATGAKLQYFLDYDVAVRSTGCEAGVQHLKGDVTLVSDTPRDIALQSPFVIGKKRVPGEVKGTQQVITHLYGPIGGRFTGLEIDGKAVKHPLVYHQHGRPVMSVSVIVPPDTTVRANWSAESGPGQTGPIDVAVTPGVQPGSKSSVVSSGC